MRLTTLSIALAIVVAVPLFAGFPGTDLILPAVGRVDGAGGIGSSPPVGDQPECEWVVYDMAFLLAGQENLAPRA
jgi:hypothetical protein